MLGKTVVELTPAEIENVKPAIEATLPPVFIELTFPDGAKSTWCLEDDFNALFPEPAKAAAS